MLLLFPRWLHQDLGIEGVFADGTTAAALNSNALQAALAAVSPATADRYRSSGWQLSFATDALVSDNNAEKFIRAAAMAFAPEQQQESRDGSSSSSGRRLVQVTSPVLTIKSVGEVQKLEAAGKPDDPGIAAMLAAAEDPYMVRFLGNWYTKVSVSAQGLPLGHRSTLVLVGLLALLLIIARPHWFHRKLHQLSHPLHAAVGSGRGYPLPATPSHRCEGVTLSGPVL